MNRILCKKAGETVPQFIARLPPSQTSSEVCKWIGVDLASDGDWEPESVGPTVHAEFAKFCSPERMAVDGDRKKKLVTMEALSKAVFERHGAVQGKWNCFVDRADVNELWAQALEFLYEGRFEERIQVSPADAVSSTHCIAIHTADYTDMKKQEQIIRAARKLGIHDTMVLKPLAATALGLYPEVPPWGERGTSLLASPREQTTIISASEHSKRIHISSAMAEARISDAL